jgi:hypothetical protein
MAMSLCMPAMPRKPRAKPGWRYRSIRSIPPTWRAVLGRALLLSGRPEQALAELQFCAARLPDYGPGLQMLVVAAAETGAMAEAQGAWRELRRLSPDLTPERVSQTWFFRDPAIPRRLLEAFHAAGLEPS